MPANKKIIFPSSTSLDWAKMAAQELNDSDPIIKLTKIVDGVSVKPYYDAKNVSQKESEFVKSGNSSWLNVPKISVIDSGHANQVALQHLNNGADGILFDLKSNGQPEQLLKDIELPHCHVFFLVNEFAPDFRDSFDFFFQSKNGYANGGFYFEGESAFASVQKFRSNGILVQPLENCVEKISSALKIACSRIDQLTEANESPEQALQSISFLWPVRTEFFISISEMRAMRICWNLFSNAYGAESAPLFLHAFSHSWTKENYQPHANIIAQTSAGLSSVLGCADAFTCEPENEDVNRLVRTSRNVSSILKEESHLDKVNDPLDGSYFIGETSMTLAESAWKKFQEMV